MSFFLGKSIHLDMDIRITINERAIYFCTVKKNQSLKNNELSPITTERIIVYIHIIRIYQYTICFTGLDIKVIFSFF